MDPSVFDPGHRLIALLGKAPKHPWAALIPQILLWSFRRFCIQKIIVAEGKLMDSLWEDHLELVHMYTPKGLETASMEWMTPDNISYVSSSLELYNRFFIEFIEAIDIVMSDDNIGLQDTFSEFLDLKMGAIISSWLSNMKEFLIFPTEPSQDDEFTDEQFSRLIDNLVAFSKATRAVPVPVSVGISAVEPNVISEAAISEAAKSEAAKSEAAKSEAAISEAAISEVKPEIPDPIKNLFPHAYRQDSQTDIWNYLSAPAMLSGIQAPQYASQYVPSPAAPVPVPVTPVQEEEPPKTVAEAIKHRRMTLRRTGRRAIEPRVKTRRSHPAA